MESFETARQHFLEGRLPQAEALCRNILAAQPQHHAALHLLGQIAHRAGRPDIASQFILQSIQLQPQNAEAHLDLGNALMACGDTKRAIAAYRNAINTRKDFAEAYANLGVALGLGSQFTEAIDALRHAIVLRPDFPEALDALGIVLRASGLAEEAVDFHRRAIQLRPRFAAAHFNLAVALQALGLIDQAISEFNFALQIDPHYRNAHSSLMYALHFESHPDSELIYQQHVSWSRSYAQPLAHLAQPHANAVDSERRLRIGCVSPDFRQHAVSFFIEGLLAAHDPRQVEVFCYVDLIKPDDTTARLQKFVPNWRDITGRSDTDVCRLIRQDQIDILVDLAGHTGSNRLTVFAARPAPVQVTYLGYIDTTGMDAIDYRMTDALADPPGMTERFHSERLLRLPQTFAVYCPPADAPPVGPPANAANGYVTFASFNTLEKINPPLLECWREILNRAPQSHLLMMAEGLQYTSVRQRITSVLQKAGIEPGRLEFLNKLSLEEYLACHGRVDVILDSFPVNGHTVTCHGLWMGVPAVSLAGNVYCQRLGLSVMHNLGLGDLVAQTPDEYVEIAVKLAEDLPRLTELRAGMRQRMINSPLMDKTAFARNIEAAYRDIFRSWCADLRK